MAPQATDLTDLDRDRTMIPDMVPCISIGSDVAIALGGNPTQLCVYARMQAGVHFYA